MGVGYYINMIYTECSEFYYINKYVSLHCLCKCLEIFDFFVMCYIHYFLLVLHLGEEGFDET